MNPGVVITGAQGFIGRHLVAHWLAIDPQVRVHGTGRSQRLHGCFSHELEVGGSRMKAPLPPALLAAAASPRFSYESIDVRDVVRMTGMLAQFRPAIIVHLAAALRGSDPEELHEGNVVATGALFDAVARAGIPTPKIVLGSSGAVYGEPGPPGLPFSEDAPCHPLDSYGRSKAAAEALAGNLSERHGIPLVRARIFNVVGAGQDPRHLCGRMAYALADVLRGTAKPELELGPLQTTRDYVGAGDVAAAIELLARRGEAGRAYNVCTQVETAGEDLLEILLLHFGLNGRVRIVQRQDLDPDVARHCGHPGRLMDLGWVPARPLRCLLSDLAEYARALNSGHPVT